MSSSGDSSDKEIDSKSISGDEIAANSQQQIQVKNKEASGSSSAASESSGGESSASEDEGEQTQNTPKPITEVTNIGSESEGENKQAASNASSDSNNRSRAESPPPTVQAPADNSASSSASSPQPAVIDSQAKDAITDKPASTAAAEGTESKGAEQQNAADNLTQKDVFGSDSSDSDDEAVDSGKKPTTTNTVPNVRDLLGDSSSDDGSDTSNKISKPVSKNRISSDDDDNETVEKAKSPVQKDTEGDAAGSNDDEARRSDNESNDARRSSQGDEGEDDPAPVAEVPEEPEETQIEVDFPLIRGDLGQQMHLVKMANFLSVETRPFDPLTYEDELDQDDTMDEEGRTRLKLKVENTIRWRASKTEDGKEQTDPLTGQPVRESNARMVRWSDGSLSLHLGTEIFDVHPMDIRSDFNHLFIRQGSGLQGQAAFKTRLTFRPHSTDSFTHRKITMSLANKSNKTQKVKILPIAGKDPESNRLEMVKKEEERLRSSIRRENMQRRMRERAAHRELSSAMLEEEEATGGDDNAISINSIKKATKEKPAKRNISALYSSASDSDDSLSSASPVAKKTKAKVISDEEDSDISD